MPRPARSPRGVLAALLAAGLAGCGLGPGERSEGEATLTVTRDYGREVLVEASVSDPAESETVLRALDREAEITTRYGGGFVQSIEGVAGGVEDGRTHDWFFFVNGTESPVGSAEVPVRAGDRIWWDHRDWTAAMRVPAVVGSWPEPFAGAGEAVLECRAAPPACEAAREALQAEGVATGPPEGRPAGEAPAMLVGPWTRIASHPAARLVARGPQVSGVFARIEDGRVVSLDERGQVAGPLPAGAGLLAATRVGEGPPTWLVTGRSARGAAAAARALDEAELTHRYAVALPPGGEGLALPVEPDG